MEFSSSQFITIRDDELRQSINANSLEYDAKSAKNVTLERNSKDEIVEVKERMVLNGLHSNDSTNGSKLQERTQLQSRKQTEQTQRVSLLNGNRGRNSQFLTCKSESGCVVFYCTLCDLELSRQEDLKEHVKEKHRNITISICPTCEKVFCRKSALTIHMRIHLDLRPFQCKICAKSFRVASHLRDHARIHTGERPFTCKYCGKGFKQTSDLRKHTFTHASNASNIRCRICRFRSHSHAAVMEHFKKSHGVIRLNEGQCCCRDPNTQCYMTADKCLPTPRNDCLGLAEPFEPVKLIMYDEDGDEEMKESKEIKIQTDNGINFPSKLQISYPSVPRNLDEFQNDDEYANGDVIRHQLLLIQGNSQHYLPIDLPCKERAVVVLQQRIPTNWQTEEPSISIICSDKK